MSEKSLRLFYALWPNKDVRVKLQQLQQHTRGRYTRPENLHITLAFLGQQAAETLPQLQNILAGLPYCDFSLSIDRLGYFKKNRIAWAGMKDIPEPLFTFQKNLVQSLDAAGIAFDSGNRFKPHVTLAREADPPLDTSFDPIVWQAAQTTLVQSTQMDGILTYRVLASHSPATST
ncbi:MAG: RNA 2',3'-cyclic phosphodiesterase [Burkholderiales bacterium]|nr:RNA 2',3'-cyclic phosphodiesterase [Burkholderiales bacterium]